MASLASVLYSFAKGILDTEAELHPSDEYAGSQIFKGGCFGTTVDHLCLYLFSKFVLSTQHFLYFMCCL